MNRFASPPNEDGTALIIALMAMMLLTALGAAVVMVSQTETASPTTTATARRRSTQPTRRSSASCRTCSSSRAGTTSGAERHSQFRRRRAWKRRRHFRVAGLITLDSQRPLQLQAITDAAGPMGGEQSAVEAVRLGAAQRDAAATIRIDSPMYVAVWVADDPADGYDAIDDNRCRTQRHADAPRRSHRPSGTRKVIEVTVARTSRTEIERGQIAQRGQEELNQRARKAAVQTPGKALTICG